MNAQSDWDMGSLEARSTKSSLFVVPWASPAGCTQSGSAGALRGVLGLQLCLDGWCVLSIIHMNARTQHFSRRKLHCKEMLIIIYSQWFYCYGCKNK